MAWLNSIGGREKWSLAGETPLILAADAAAIAAAMSAPRPGTNWEERRLMAPGVATGVEAARAEMEGMGGRVGRWRAAFASGFEERGVWAGFEAGGAGRVAVVGLAASFSAGMGRGFACVGRLVPAALEPAAPGAVICVRVVMPIGVVTVMVVTPPSSWGVEVETEHSMR